MFRVVSLAIALSFLLAACSGPAGAPALPTEQPPTTEVPTAMPTETPPPDPTKGPEEPVTGVPGPGGTPGAQPWEPQPDDARLTRGEVFLDGAEVLVLESFPLQVRLHLAGSLPTGCHQLRVAVTPPDANNAIAVEVYTVVDPNLMCAQVLAEFDQAIPLGSFPTDEHPSGSYTVVVNGETAGEFTA
jgi:hypothetical protein